MAQKGKPQAAPAKAVSDPIVEALQRELKQQGFYSGPIDGQMGDSTKAAVQARDAKKAADEEAKGKTADRELERLKLEQAGKKTDVDVKAAEAKIKRKEAYDEQSNSVLGIATRSAAGAPAFFGGYLGGRYLGSMLNESADASQRSKNNVLLGAAEDRKTGLTTREGARAGVKLSGAMPQENPLLRAGGRAVPHAIIGGMMLGKGGLMLAQEGEDDPFYPSMLNRAAGLGMIGAGAGAFEQGANYAINPGVAPDARSIAVIESNQLRRNGQGSGGGSEPPAPRQPRPVLPGSRQDLMAQARRYSIAGRSSMTTDELRAAVGEAVKSTAAPRGGAASKALKGLAGPLAGPAIAAGLAYSMTPDRAQAADGSVSGGNQAEALTNAGVAGGAAYGANRLLRAIPSTLGQAASVAGEAMAPLTIDAMTDYSPDEIQQGRNWVIQNIPAARHLGGGFRQAYEESLVPERNPLRAQAPQQTPEQELPSAAALEIPSDMVAQPAQEPEGDFESQLAELQSMLQQIGQAQEAGPVSNAANSQAASRAQFQPAPSPWQTTTVPTNRLLAGTY